MAIPANAARFTGALDPEEVLDYIVPIGPLLEAGETIDPDPDRWSLTLLAEAVALGLEIIESDPDWPDPALVVGDTRFVNNTAIKFWARVDPAFQDNAAFAAGVALPMEATCWTSSNPPRRRQRTFLLNVVEQ